MTVVRGTKVGASGEIFQISPETSDLGLYPERRCRCFSL